MEKENIMLNFVKKFIGVLTLGAILFFPILATSEVKLPSTVSWTAYNVGSTGYSQSVAIGKTLQDAYGTTIRVVP